MTNVDLITYYDSLPNVYLQANKAATNLFFPSASPTSVSLTIPATEHILWVEGTGSVTSSYGTATEAAPLIFTGTAASVTFTCTNIDIAQIEVGNLKTTYIPTTTAAASIPALSYLYPAVNIDTSDSQIGLKIDYEGDDVVVMDIGGVPLLEITAGTLKLSDGVNELTQVISEGSNQIDVKLTATTMQLIAGGSTQNGPYTPISAGLITVSEDHYDLQRSTSS